MIFFWCHNPGPSSHLFSRAGKKGFSFFSCGATSSRTVPKTQPLQVAFSLRERVGLRSQKGLRLALPATEVPKPQTPKSARGGAWGSAGRKWGARESAPESARESACEGARESARPPFSCAKENDEHFPKHPRKHLPEHSPEHFPKHPTSGRHSPKHSPKHLPEHFLGFGASAPL